jgi:hypothetical protein
MGMDRELVGRLIRRQIDRDFGGNVQELVRATGRGKAREVSRDRIYKAIDGDDSVTIKMWRRIETGLGFPFDSLALVAAHDFDQLEDEGAPADVVAWLRKQAERGSPAGGSAAM